MPSLAIHTTNSNKPNALNAEMNLPIEASIAMEAAFEDDSKRKNGITTTTSMTKMTKKNLH
eukprot:9771767-Ditylum_brightwellii.AAC.1